MREDFPLDFLSIDEFNSQNKSAYYRPFKHVNFVRIYTKKMIDYQYRKNSARNTYSNVTVR